MLPVGSRTVCSAVGEASLGRVLSGPEGETDRPLEAEVIEPEETTAEELSSRDSDCLVVDGAAPTVDVDDILQRWTDDCPDVPVVVLVDGWDADRVADALSAGATETLPRGLVDADPDLLAERVAATVEREHARAGIQELYDNLDGAVVLHDPESGEIVHANQSFCDLLKYDRERLLSMGMAGLVADVPGHDHERMTNVVASAAGQDEPIEVEWPVTTADDAVRWIESRLRGVKVGGREVVLSTSVDVTEERRQEHKYEQVFDNVNDVISVHDPWDEELLDVNETLCDLTGYGREALIEMDIGGFSVAEEGFTDERAYEIQQRVAATGESETVEWMIETAAGERRLLEVKLAPTTIAGEDRVLALSRDVTERTEYERQLERERDRRSVLFENNPDPVVRVRFEDEDPIIREVNPAFEEVFGFPPDDVVGSTVAEAVVPESEREEHERFSDRVARGESVEAEARRQTADGIREFRFRVIHFSTDPAADEATDAYVWYTDITERKRREREYEQLFNGVNDSITVHDPETAELLEVNQTFCDLLGYDREAILDMGIEGYSPSDEGYTMEQAREFVSRVVDSDEPRETEWVVETSDGEKRWLDVKGTTVELGGERRYVSIDRDITERKRREREYEQIFDGVNDSIVVQNPETAQPLDANRTFLDRLGYDSVEEIREAGFDELSASDAGYTRERAQEICQRVMETGEPETVEWQQETRSGERRWIEATVDAAEIRGEDRILSMQRDITERKRREQMIRALHEATDEMQEAETPEAVCTAAVDAATEVLDLWLPTCWLHEDDECDHLSPVARGDEADDLSPDDRPRALDPDDFEYGVYEDGERAVCDPADLDGGTPPGDAVLFPLGEHGLFGAVERDGEFDDVTLDAAGILARHVTAALDRVERARELRESERRFRLIADHIDEIIYVSTADFSEILYINPAYEEIYGRPVEELAEDPTSFVEAAHPDDRAEYEADAERLIEDVEAGNPQDAYEGEYRIERDGETRWVTVTRFPVATEGGTVDRIVGRVQDVTERKRREREYEQIFHGVHDAIVVHDPETGEMVDVNDRFCELMGYDRETVLELGTPGVSVPEEGFTQERAEEIIDEVMEAGELEPFEWQVETSDGERRVLEVRATRAGIGGEPRHISINRDITERRRREREYEQIFNMAGDGIVIHDPESGEVVDANEQVADLLGYDREAFLDRPLSEFQATDEGVSGEEAREMVLESVREDGREFEWPLETSDGDTVWVRARHELGDIGGEQRIVALLHDITERRRREREYEQIFDGVNDVIAIHDPETGEMVDVNSTMCDLTGYDRETILELGAEELLVGDPDVDFEPERVPEIIDRVMNGEDIDPYEQMIETSDGERVWLEVNPTRAVIGGEERFLAISRDITERRHTERRLGEILDRIDDAIFMARAEAITAASQDPDYVSSGYEEIWGQPLETIRETYDDGFFGTLHPDDAGEYRTFVEGIVDDIRAGAAADSYSREYRIERPDGEVRWVQSDYYPTEWASGEPRVVIVSRDVTERKSRERRIASFDDATDDLATADTPEEATRTAVEAATETLDLPAVGAFLYDDEDGVLRPEVLTGQLPADVAADPVGPGDGPLWKGFATGTIVASDGGHSEPGFAGEADDAEPPGALGDLAEWRALALGNHGVLLVGSPDTELGPETVQAAHVLAATLEAALNHLEGEQRLAAQEEQLRTQTERADRLDRIARLTQQVEAAITEASNPGEVEQAVCDRLAGSGPYDLAWIGGLDVGSDRFAARAVVGASNQYVDALDLTTADETADPHPAVDAWRSDEVQVANSLVGDGPAGDWRRQGLSEGYQSLCAVPLTYDGITHGVLTVGTDSPNAFDDRERDVLAQLGRSIANAIAAIERRRALESDETVELEFSGSGEALSFARAASAADCRVRLERTAARQDGPVSVYYSFEGDVPDDATEIASRRLPGSIDVVAEESSSTLVEAQSDDWFGAPLAEYGGVLREASAEPGETTVRVEVPREADVRSFVERLQEIAPSLELVAQRQHRRRDRTPAEISDQVRAELTDRQFEVVQTALSAGYFEWPREHDGSEVAAQLDITQPTFNKHLRLAQRKTFGLLFEAES